ncbi:MAG: cobalamin-dependent protein [Chloroflexota bacterium]
MAKILFTHPLFLKLNPDEQAASSPYFPLGLLYLAGYVREHGHEVAIFDGTFADGEADFLAALETHQPDVVGVSALLPTRDMALQLAKLAHQQNYIVILGGPDPTKSPAHYLAHEQVDIVVHHEGEQTILALLNQFDAGTLTLESIRAEQGVAFRDDGKVIVNKPRPPIADLDTLPMPARDLIDMHRYLNVWEETNGYASMTLSTSRGCPYGCEWCEDAVHGQAYRQRSPESVAAEMKMLKETYSIDRLRLVDDVDGIKREWLDEWAETAVSLDAVIPFEALNDLERQDIPMLDVRDSL